MHISKIIKKLKAASSLLCYLSYTHRLVQHAYIPKPTHTEQLTTKLTLACTIHACVYQYYSRDQSELVCHRT